MLTWAAAWMVHYKQEESISEVQETEEFSCTHKPIYGNPTQSILDGPWLSVTIPITGWKVSFSKHTELCSDLQPARTDPGQQGGLREGPSALETVSLLGGSQPGFDNLQGTLSTGNHWYLDRHHWACTLNSDPVRPFSTVPRGLLGQTIGGEQHHLHREVQGFSICYLFLHCHSTLNS